MYIHELPNWPNFTWRSDRLEPLLASVRHQQGRLLGRMETLDEPSQVEATFDFLMDDVIETSAIEGDRLDPEQVRSSLAWKLGVEAATPNRGNRHVDGVVAMILDAVTNNNAPLTKERLWTWHAGLFPSGWSGSGKVQPGAWRTGPMNVISAQLDQARVHFEAPAPDRVPFEMDRFLEWFESEGQLDPVLKAGIAHLWFVTIHPFDDGNGRIARAIADLALARSEGSRWRFYSLSSQIQRERADYYRRLETTQKGPLDITFWLVWFLNCLGRAVDSAETAIQSSIAKARFWDGLSGVTLNARHRKVLNLLLDGFEDPLTSSKWAKLTKVSQDTAARDIGELVEHGVLIRNPGSGRSTSYALNRS